MLELALGLFVVMLFVLANGFFVASEFSLVAVRRSRVEQLENEGHPLAGSLRHAVDHLDGYLAATQLGITLASIGLGFVGEPALARVIEPALHGLPGPLPSVGAHTIAIVVAFIIISALHIVLGELTPKSLALQRSEQTALLVARPTRFFLIILWPFIWVLNGAGNLLLRLLGLRPPEGHELVHSVEELKLLVAASHEAGVLEEVEEELIERALDFGETHVHEIMVPRTAMVAIPASTPLSEAIRRAVQSGHTRLPVYHESVDNVVGIAHLRDMIMAQLEGKRDGPPNGRDVPIGSVARSALYVPEQSTVDAVLTTMRRQAREMAIVIDEHGGTAGLVTLADVVEEIVGALRGEFEPIRTFVRMLPDGNAIVDGLTPIDDVNEKLGLSIEDPDHDTIGGFVTGQLGRIPEVGDEVVVDHCVLHVESMARRRVGTLRLIRQSIPAEPEPVDRDAGKGE